MVTKFILAGGVLALLVLLAAGCRGSGANPDGTPTITVVQPTQVAQPTPVQVSTCRNDDYPPDAPQFADVDVSGAETTSGGVMFVDVSDGAGDAVTSPAAAIRLRYSGWLQDGCLFDSSYLAPNNNTVDFLLSNLIPGFAEGTQGMRPGGERRIVIPPELAYGAAGAGNAIPPNATIHFNIELVEILVPEVEEQSTEMRCFNDSYPADAPQFDAVDVSGGATTVGGVRLVDVSEGTGETLSSFNATVRVHYSGWLEDGCLFDSSYIRNNSEPVEFPLSDLIPGFGEGIQGMKVGGERRIAIPPHLAYGTGGAPGFIPPNATIHFSVRLEAITN